VPRSVHDRKEGVFRMMLSCYGTSRRKIRDGLYLTVKNDEECDGDKCSKKNCQVGGKSYFKGKGHGSSYRL
jgi:hypothetical protein